MWPREHDVHFEELLSQGVTFEQVRAYILLRQSQLSMEDRKKIIVEMGGSLEYKKVCSSIRLLGSRFFADLQGQKTAKTRTYDANLVEDAPPEEGERAYGAFSASAADEGEIELDDNFLEIMVASEDQDALQVQAFEEELENFFQDTPELQEALVSYIEARSRLLAKKKSRGFWPIGAGKGSTKGGRGFKGSGKGKGKHREQLLARIARSTCRICGEKGHWKAECPRRKQSSSGEATTTVAEAFAEALEVPGLGDEVPVPEISTQLPADALSLEEALVVCSLPNPNEINLKLQKLVQKLKTQKPNLSKISFHRPRNSGEPRLTDESCCFLKRSCDSEPAIAALVHHQGPVEAILDTGASRCVMGKSLLQRFLGQLNDSVRSRVRVTKSSIRFRFGNNQTLLSERRIHLPFGTPNQQVLWLGIEIVPGSTPLLFSKRAIKQLGGLIDTEADVCELRRLQRSLLMQTGPTGLYMIDLARLCEVAAFADPCMLGSSLGMRLARLRDPVQNLTLEQLQALSLEAHGAHVVNFGTKVKGRTFQDVVENEAEWTKWIVEHMSTSPKRSHQSFIMYVEKYVSQAEEIEAALIETAISGEPPVRMIAQAKPKVRSSSKAAPKASSRPVTEAVSEDPWEFMEEPAITDQVTALNHRMLTMEQMMQEMISAIQRLSVGQNAS
ncbi:unnamed protein product [Symbiodinium necroappetens]|uniref:CCHC-type domain-containing protein n=1 Tax=Symbiodinium necroappetens TaxID=1628268 RepID=A0A813C6F0_9DINO|nr:unnamed protein product [Symbiodinium necroappetens]